MGVAQILGMLKHCNYSHLYYECFHMAVGWRGGDVGVVVYDVKINNRLRVSGISIKKHYLRSGYVHATVLTLHSHCASIETCLYMNKRS